MNIGITLLLWYKSSFIDSSHKEKYPFSLGKSLIYTEGIFCDLDQQFSWLRCLDISSSFISIFSPTKNLPSFHR